MGPVGVAISRDKRASRVPQRDRRIFITHENGSIHGCSPKAGRWRRVVSGRIHIHDFALEQVRFSRPSRYTTVFRLEAKDNFGFDLSPRTKFLLAMHVKTAICATNRSVRCFKGLYVKGPAPCLCLRPISKTLTQAKMSVEWIKKSSRYREWIINVDTQSRLTVSCIEFTFSGYTDTASYTGPSQTTRQRILQALNLCSSRQQRS
jgi:hypothetical protein